MGNSKLSSVQIKLVFDWLRQNEAIKETDIPSKFLENINEYIGDNDLVVNYLKLSNLNSAVDTAIKVGDNTALLCLIEELDKQRLKMGLPCSFDEGGAID